MDIFILFGLFFSIRRENDAERIDENHTVVATAKGIFTSKGGILEAPGMFSL